MRLAPMVLAIILARTAACSGGGTPAADTGRNPTQRAAYHLFQRYAQFVRRHGTPDRPDPTDGTDRNVDFPSGLSHLLQSAPGSYDPILNDLPVDARIGQPSARPDLPMLRRFAQCMRDQPQLASWPDPDRNGTFHLPGDLVGTNGTRQAQFLAGLAARAHFNPSGHLQLTGR